MKKEARTHLIYAAVLFLVAASFIFYHDYTLNQTKNYFDQKFRALSQEFQETKKQLNQEVQTLQEETGALTGQVQDLDTSLQEKGRAIRDLSGEIEEVRSASESQVQQLQQSVAKLKAEYEDFSDIIDQSVRGVVSIQTNIGSGSGFFFRSDGYILTNYHVVKGAMSAKVVTYDGNSHGVYLVGYDSGADLAVLWVNETGLDWLKLGDSSQTRVGEKVIAIGNPGGLDFTVTQGIVSAVNREDSQGNHYIQIDVPINPGNSGGPLIDTQGEVIGVNTLKREGFEGVGFALASNDVSEAAEEIMAEAR